MEGLQNNVEISISSDSSGRNSYCKLKEANQDFEEEVVHGALQNGRICLDSLPTWPYLQLE